MLTKATVKSFFDNDSDFDGNKFPVYITTPPSVGTGHYGIYMNEPERVENELTRIGLRKSTYNITDEIEIAGIALTSQNLDFISKSLQKMTNNTFRDSDNRYYSTSFTESAYEVVEDGVHTKEFTISVSKFEKR